MVTFDPNFLSFKMGENRFHRQAWQMVTFLAVCKNHLIKPTTAVAATMLRGNTIPFDIHISILGVHENYIRGHIGLNIWFGMDEKRDPKLKANYFDYGESELSHIVFCGIFSMSVDPFSDWQKSVNSDYAKWPPVLNFCRVVRNAIAHGGTFNISNPNAVPVKWRGLCISKIDNGRPLGNVITTGDFVVLLNDLNEELDSLSAPMGFGWQKIESDSEDASLLRYSTPPLDQASIA